MAVSSIAAVAGLFEIWSPVGLEAQPSPAFEVASVKPERLPKGTYGWGTGGAIRIGGNRVTTSGTLAGLVMAAYDLKEYQISGAPNWSDESGGRQYFDISAKVEGEGAAPVDQVRRMLQTLLAERFQLNVHRETRDLPVYDLILGKNGTRMKEQVGDKKPTRATTVAGLSMRFKFENETIDTLISTLAPNVDRPVLDETGLTGGYDFTFEYERRDPRIGDPSRSMIFEAVQEQLGLKLAPAMEPLEFLVIDSVERPSAD